MVNSPLLRIRAIFSGLVVLFLASSVLSASQALVATPDELTAAIASARAGDEIVLRNGTWRDVRIRFKATGTESAPIILRAETPGEVRLSGDSRLGMAGQWLEVRGLVFEDGHSVGADVVEFRLSQEAVASNCRLVDCAIIDYNHPDQDDPNKWVSVYGQDNTVERCHFSGKTNRGTTLTVWLDPKLVPNRTVIRGNYFGPRPSGGGENDFETIRVGTSRTSHLEAEVLVESNYFEACNGEIEVISNKSCGNVYRDNVFVNCVGQLTLRHGNRCVVEGNAFYGGGIDRTGGVRIIGENHIIRGNYFYNLCGAELRSVISLMSGEVSPKPSGYFQVMGAQVEDNLIVDCELAFGIGALSSNKPTVLPPVDSTIQGNRVFISSGDLLEFYRESPAVSFADNAVYGDVLPLPEGFAHIEDVDGTQKAAAVRPPPCRNNYGPAWTVSSQKMDNAVY